MSEYMDRNAAKRYIDSHYGRRVAPSTIWRWCLEGVGPKRRQLRYACVGRHLLLKKEDIQEFFTGLAQDRQEVFAAQAKAADQAAECAATLAARAPRRVRESQREHHRKETKTYLRSLGLQVRD